jgi:NhaP-type Na+/H+ or K+/H+ antiporter
VVRGDTVAVGVRGTILSIHAGSISARDGHHIARRGPRSGGVARRVLIPYPIFLVLGGLVLSVVPNVPVVRLDPDLVFLIFLPPILWAAAYFTSLRDFQANFA